jgi:hypothetical protein
MQKTLSFFSTLFILFFIAVSSSCKNSGSGAGTVLKFNPEKGKRYSYDITWDTDQKVMDRNDKISLQSNFLFEMISDDGPVNTLKGEYRRFRLYMKIMDLEMEIDTDKPVAAASGNESMEGMMQRLFAKMKGRSVTMKVDERGSIQSVTGFDEIINGIIDAAGLNEEMELQMRASLNDQFSEQELKNQLEPVFLNFPDQAVKQGDSWQRKYGITGKVPADFTTTYTVKQIEGDHVTLDSESIIGPAGQGMQIKGKQSGKLLVNSKTGLVLNAEFKQEMETSANDLAVTINSAGKVTGSVED